MNENIRFNESVTNNLKFALIQIIDIKCYNKGYKIRGIYNTQKEAEDAHKRLSNLIEHLYVIPWRAFG